MPQVQYCDWQRSSGLRVLRQVRIILYFCEATVSVNNFHAVLLWLIVLLLKVLERQKLLETADGMGGQTGSNRQADQKVVMVVVMSLGIGFLDVCTGGDGNALIYPFFFYHLTQENVLQVLQRFKRKPPTKLKPIGIFLSSNFHISKPCHTSRPGSYHDNLQLLRSAHSPGRKPWTLLDSSFNRTKKTLDAFGSLSTEL